MQRRCPQLHIAIWVPKWRTLLPLATSITCREQAALHITQSSGVMQKCVLPQKQKNATQAGLIPQMYDDGLLQVNPWKHGGVSGRVGRLLHVWGTEWFHGCSWQGGRLALRVQTQPLNILMKHAPYSRDGWAVSDHQCCSVISCRGQKVPDQPTASALVQPVLVGWALSDMLSGALSLVERPAEAYHS